MPSADDSPTAAGGTNVFLTQRMATAPYRREEVSIQGDENPMKALGFDAAGILRTLSVAQMIEDDPEAAKEALGYGPDASVGLEDMDALDQGKIVGRKSTGTGIPEAVTVAEMIALDPAAAQTALGPVDLSDMAALNQGKVIGRVSTGAGIPEAVTVPQMIALDPEAARVALSVIESPFVSVDTEAQFDAALAAGRSIKIRDASTVITLTTPKVLITPHMTIAGPGHLQFNGLPADARCIQIKAPDVTLRDFELSSTQNLSVAAGVTPQTAIDFPSVNPAVAHRARFLRLDIHQFHRCVGRWTGGATAPYIDDVLFEDCYMHVFRGGLHLEAGFRRLTVRNCRVLGKQVGETHLCDWAAFHSGGDTEDVLIEGGTFGFMPNYMGIEITINVGTVNLRPKIVRTRVISTAGYGISFGHCQQGYAEGVLIDDATGVGFEVGGDSTAKGRASATLVGCEVRNLKEVLGANPSDAANGIAGFTVDGSVDTLLLGCRANGIIPVGNRFAIGIYVSDSDRAAIENCTVIDARTGVHLWKGLDYPNTGGFHVVTGCTFRHTSNLANQYSVTVADINAIVRNNTTFCRPGGGMTYLAACTAGAGVICDDTNPPLVAGTFTGSNRVVPVPA